MAEFRNIKSTAIIPSGWRLATKLEVENFKPTVEALLGTWDTAALQDGWAINGSGYGYTIIQKNAGSLGEKIIIKIPDM